MSIVKRIFSLADEQFAEQKDFAKALDLPPSIISEWRREKSSSFTKRIPEIARVLGTTSDYLLTGEKNETRASESGDGQAQKLARAMQNVGIDVDELTEVDMARIAQMAKIALDK